jgi:hypothetical protein
MQLRMNCNELKEDVAWGQQSQPRAFYRRHFSGKAYPASLSGPADNQRGNGMWLSGFTIYGWERGAFQPQPARNIFGLFWCRSSSLCISILMLLK